MAHLSSRAQRRIQGGAWIPRCARDDRYDFLYAIKRSGYDLGDQIMIQLCADIVQFEDHLTVSPGAVEKVGLPALFVTIYF